MLNEQMKQVQFSRFITFSILLFFVIHVNLASSSTISSVFASKPVSFGLFSHLCKRTEVEKMRSLKPLADSKAYGTLSSGKDSLLTFDVDISDALPAEIVVDSKTIPEELLPSNLLSRVLASGEMYKSDSSKDRVIFDKFGGSSIVSLSAWPVGWNNFALILHRDDQADKKEEHDDDDDDNSTTRTTKMMNKKARKGDKTSTSSSLLDFRSPDVSSFVPIAMLPKRLRVEVRCEIVGTKTMRISIKSSSVGISAAHAKRVKHLLKEYFHARLSDYVSIASSRMRMKQSYAQSALAEKKMKTERELDRIINPDKYKKKRVASSGGRQGTGRYTPSASTRARREVRRG